MNWMVRIFWFMCAAGIVTAHFGVAALAGFFAVFTAWAKHKFDVQEYIYARHQNHAHFHESSMLSHQPHEPDDLDMRECEASKPRL